jgi:hypothetical protein
MYYNFSSLLIKFCFLFQVNLVVDFLGCRSPVVEESIIYKGLTWELMNYTPHRNDIYLN